jgi:hypothetical protein
MEIPRPPRGYWQKLAAGKAPPKPKLKPLTEKGVSETVIRGMGENHSDQGEQIPVPSISVPSDLEEPHPLTAKTLNALQRARTGEFGLLAPKHRILLDINVSRENVERSCLIMDVLIKTLEERGYRVVVTKDSPPKTVVAVESDTWEIGLDEETRRTDHEPTEAEKKKPNWYWWEHRYDYHPTGRLVLRIRNANHLSVRKQWADGKVQRVENCLGSFIAGLQIASIAAEEDREEKARWKREWQESQRLAELERERVRFEEARQEKLKQDVSDWESATRIRKYIAALRSEGKGINGMDEWIAWAERYADSLDPFRNPATLVFQPEKKSLIIP